MKNKKLYDTLFADGKNKVLFDTLFANDKNLALVKTMFGSIETKTLISINVIALKEEFAVDEPLVNGMEVRAVYDDFTSEDVTALATIVPDKAVEGASTAVVSYGGFSVDFDYTGIAPTPYYAGWNFKDAQVAATVLASEPMVDDWTVENINALTPGIYLQGTNLSYDSTWEAITTGKTNNSSNGFVVRMPDNLNKIQLNLKMRVDATDGTPKTAFKEIFNMYVAAFSDLLPTDQSVSFGRYRFQLNDSQSQIRFPLEYKVDKSSSWTALIQPVMDKLILNGFELQWTIDFVNKAINYKVIYNDQVLADYDCEDKISDNIESKTISLRTGSSVDNLAGINFIYESLTVQEVE